MDNEVNIKLQSTVPKTAPLGQKSPYPKSYNKSLLQPILRADQRRAMKIFSGLSQKGFDVWNAYELYWLSQRGKPVRATGTFFVPADSKFLVESKSVKLYLNSLNQEKFSSVKDVQSIITKDLSDACQSSVHVEINSECLNQYNPSYVKEYECLDDLDIEIQLYKPAPHLIKVDHSDSCSIRVMTNLFKSHCLCTGQPDLGSIFIEYQGPKIGKSGLLAYLISYRDHSGFSENCIEQIFYDIYQAARPKRLTVFGRFTRRGGIDINPYRSNEEVSKQNSRLVYQ